MKRWGPYLLLLIIMTILGCRTMPSQIKEKDPGALDKSSRAEETKEEISTAIGTIADAITKKGIRVKYCPVCGKHYSFRLERCPIDDMKLKEIED